MMARLNTNTMLPKNTVIATEEDDMSVLEIVQNFGFDKLLNVLSFDGKKDVMATVTSTRRSDTRNLLLIECGYNEIKLILTPDHKVYDLHNRKFTRAMDLKTGTPLKHVDDIDIHVTGVRNIQNTSLEDVYTLTIDETQCFYADGVLVHNDL